MRFSLARTLPLILAAGALPLAAQTTGTLQGRVLDAKRNPIAGAIVQVTGNNVQGGRHTATDADGKFWVGSLPPGTVLVTATNPGHSTSKVTVLIGLGKTASVDIALAAQAAATVVVEDRATTVDVKGTSSGTNFTNTSYEQLPVDRDFASIATLTPGVNQDTLPNGQVGLRVYGASGTENNYVVDGINTTNAEFGTQGKKIPVEFIKEFQVKTGGYDAEFGKSTGGVINVITKSGGNEFEGDVFTYLQSQGLQATNKHLNQSSTVGFTPLTVGYRNADFGFDAGGALIKDKLWYFVAYDRTNYSRTDQIQLGTTAGQNANSTTKTDLYSVKLTWKLNETQTLIASVLGDPSTTDGEVDGHPAMGPKPTWDGHEQVGGTDLSLRYELTGDSWLGTFQVSRHKETDTIQGGMGQDIVQEVTTGGALLGGFGRWDKKDFTRTNYEGSFTKMFEAMGSHEAKIGFDLQTDLADCYRNYSGGQQIIDMGPDNNGVQYYGHYGWTTYDYNLPSSVIPGDPSYVYPAGTTVPLVTFHSQPKHNSQAFYLQDKWSPQANLTVNAGLRMDQTKILDQFGNTVINLNKELAPRLGMIYDWKGKGQDKLYLSLCRYYQQLPMDLVIRSFSIERNPTVYNYQDNAGPTSLQPVVIPVPNSNTPPIPAVIGQQSTITGSSAEPIDPDLKGEYKDEFTLGVETTVMDNYVLGAKYIRNYFGRVIEDALDNTTATTSQAYLIMNPGLSHDVGVQYPRAIRDYKGIELTFTRKLLDNYTYTLSYLWSELTGNYEGGFSGVGGPSGTGQLDPNITAAFDEPAFLVNNYGPLSSDHKHQLKGNGLYDFGNGLTIGATASLITGTPINRMGSSDNVQPIPYSNRWELFLLPRGSQGRTPTITQLDLNFAYAFSLRAKQRLTILMDVKNILDSQAATAVDQRYNFHGGDLGQTNPNFNQPIAYQAPRSIRFGVRYSF